MDVMGDSTNDDNNNTEDDDYDYEEKIIILELNGVLDGEAVRQAARYGQLVVRKADSQAPLVQIGSSIYTSKWNQTIGTDLIFHTTNKIIGPTAPVDIDDVLQPSSVSSSQLDLIGVSSTRLTGHKAIITAMPAAANPTSATMATLNSIQLGNEANEGVTEVDEQMDEEDVKQNSGRKRVKPPSGKKSTTPKQTKKK